MIDVIDEFRSMLDSLAIAKMLYDIDRFDIVETEFSDTLDLDDHFQNLYGVINSIFSNFSNYFIEHADVEIMVYKDDCISNFFAHVCEYGERNNIPHDQNPYVAEANEEVRRRLNGSHCVDWKLIGYTRTKRLAKKSKLIVHNYTNCSCSHYDLIACGLIKIYEWFTQKCAEFDKAAATAAALTEPPESAVCKEPKILEPKTTEVLAA